MRRFAGTCLLLLLANLSVARAAITCAAGAEHAATQPVQGQDHSGHGGHEAPTQDAPTPSPEQCCQAMTSCAVAADAAADQLTNDAPIASESGTWALLMAPVGRVSAPEPPPPRV